MRAIFYPKKLSEVNRQHRRYMKISLLMMFIGGQPGHGKIEQLNITEVVSDTFWG